VIAVERVVDIVVVPAALAVAAFVVELVVDIGQTATLANEQTLYLRPITRLTTLVRFDLGTALFSQSCQSAQ